MSGDAFDLGDIDVPQEYHEPRINSAQILLELGNAADWLLDHNEDVNRKKDHENRIGFAQVIRWPE